jgi:hypothetical protein
LGSFFRKPKTLFKIHLPSQVPFKSPVTKDLLYEFDEVLEMSDFDKMLI